MTTGPEGLDRVAVVTIAHGRHEHLRNQVRGLCTQPGLGIYVVVAMDDPAVAALISREVPPATTVLVRELASTQGQGELPLAAARNLGVRTAIDAGADVVVLLDVDCIPAPGLVSRYAAAARVAGDRPTPVVLCGEVSYLPPGIDPATLSGDELGAVAEPHPARPRLDPGVIEESRRFDLFWSLSFAMTADHWSSVGGFCEQYVGYGGEDTDFGQLVAAAGGALQWVGGCQAFHQHHGTTTPPVQHLAAIVRNANLFHRRWGWFPMTGWLQAFDRLELASLDTDRQRWSLSAAQRQP